MSNDYHTPGTAPREGHLVRAASRRPAGDGARPRVTTMIDVYEADHRARRRRSVIWWLPSALVLVGVLLGPWLIEWAITAYVRGGVR